jgi:GTP-dependent phosphoenolpyruvate carboxykinase
MPYNRIVRILDVSDYKITCLFNTKESRVVDFGPFIKANKTNKIVEALLDKVYFLNVAIDEIGGLYWPNGFDCSANKIYDWDKKNIEDRNKEKNLV